MTIPINVTGAQRKKCVNITNPNDNCSSIPNEINTKTPKKSNDPQPPAVDGNIPAKLAAVPKKRTVNISSKKLSKVKFTETAIKKYIVISKIQIKNEINNNLTNLDELFIEKYPSKNCLIKLNIFFIKTLELREK